MMKSLTSAVSGLRAQQTAMDVIGNNIANVNTPGFRSSSTQFEDLFYQNLNAGSAQANPSQVGYGAQVSGVSKNMKSTGATITDNPWDLYIDGDGYFQLSTPTGSGVFYTRVGNFTFNTDGSLVDSTGNYVQGTDGTTNAAGKLVLQNLNLIGCYINGQEIVASGATGTQINYGDLRDITFNTDGSISASANSVMGKISTDTGATKELKVALATFVNENGLSQVGGNNYEATEASGAPVNTTALSNSTTKIRANELEMSNVDLAKEFTTMIVTQRGYQANSRVITVSDSMLEELINLKRS